MERCKQLLVSYPEFEHGSLMAQNWFEDNQTKESQSAFWRNIVEQRPDCIIPHIQFGILMEDMGDHAAAADAFAKAYANDPENAAAAIRYATQLDVGLKADAAITIINNVCENYPDKQPLALYCLEKAAARSEKSEAYADAAAYRLCAEMLQFSHAYNVAQQGNIEEACESNLMK